MIFKFFRCAGGFPIRAWMHWVYHGVVTGGDFNEKFGCQPYPFPPCAHQKDHTNQLPRCSKMLYATPQCMQKCNNNYYSKGYIQDKYYGNDLPLILNELIMYEFLNDL